VNFIIHATGCLEGLLTTGYEKIVMDADRCSAMSRFVQGVDFSEAGQAMEAFFWVHSTRWRILKLRSGWVRCRITAPMSNGPQKGHHGNTKERQRE